ncbi:MAG: apolipoprotein N-acyltransferase [SAR324 cluster bacterium]|nr:apolipoprotein N-acyltransferase [SAR324 cluster bacterium]
MLGKYNLNLNFNLYSLIESGFWALLSASFFILSRPGLNAWYLAWICFVPLLIATRDKGAFSSFWMASLFLAIVYLFTINWISYLAKEFLNIPYPLNHLFMGSYAFYSGIRVGIIFFCYKFLVKHSFLPDFIIFPLTFCVIWGLYPVVFAHSFAETQIVFPIALQAISIFGAMGANFVITLNSGLVFALFSGSWRRHWVLFSLGILVIISWFSYGIWQYPIWQKKQSSWPITKFGLIQPNKKASLYKSPIEDGYSKIYPWEMSETKKLVKDNDVAFVIWPEGNTYNYSTDPAVKQSFDAYAKNLSVNLLFSEVYQKIEASGKKWFNAVVWINSQGQEMTPYFKRMLVPFGEYTPGRFLLDPLLGLFNQSLPGLTAGKDFNHFKNKIATIIPVICYEGIFSEHLAEAANVDIKKRLFVLVSQDGWYDSKHQVYEHSFSSMLRAIENKIPLLHVVQNGFSSIVFPSGDYRLLTNYQERGSAVVEIPLAPDVKKTFFTRYPHLFLNTIRIIFGLMAGLALLKYYKGLYSEHNHRKNFYKK